MGTWDNLLDTKPPPYRLLSSICLHEWGGGHGRLCLAAEGVAHQARHVETPGETTDFVTEKIASIVALTRWKTEVIEGKIDTRKNFGYKVAKMKFHRLFTDTEDEKLASYYLCTS